MSLQVIHKFEASDTTEALNKKLEILVEKGIYSGGFITPQGGTLTCYRTPILAVSYDGMTIFDTEQQTFEYTDGIANYHVIRAKYNAAGNPASVIPR